MYLVVGCSDYALHIENIYAALYIPGPVSSMTHMHGVHYVLHRFFKCSSINPTE